MTKARILIPGGTRFARQVCIGIGVVGMLLLASLNWSFYLIFSGVEYTSKVVEIEKDSDGCYRIVVEFARTNGEWVQKRLTDCTAETALFWIKAGNTLKLWESKSQPYRHYVPFTNFAVKIMIVVFFIFVPFLFAAFGRF